MTELTIKTSFAGVMQRLGDAERGRLFSAMLVYAQTGEEIELRGNETYVFPAAKMMIDAQRNDEIQEKERKKQRKERETRSNKSINQSLSKIIPPTIEMIKDRCDEKGYTLSPEAFFNHYNSVGWYVGKKKMVDWHAALAGWQTRETQYRRDEAPKRNVRAGYANRTVTMDMLSDIIVDLTAEDGGIGGLE